MPTPPMTRRDALKAAGLLLGTAAVASAGGLDACAPDPHGAPARPTSGVLAPDDQALVEQIADTLLPTTAASPGAKAAGVGAGVNLLLTDCYDADAQRRVVAGLAEFRTACRDRRGGAFATLLPQDREALLREVDAEAHRAGSAHYFTLVRELAERAYFSSEIGMTRALRYVLVPGRWQGCVPLAPGQPAWG